MPEGAELDWIAKADLLQTEELLALLQEVFIPAGFTRFRLTGGEPLVHPHVVEIVRQIARLPHLTDLSMTTNGFLLAGRAQDLYNAGLHRINISLDSLQPEVFDQIIGNRGRSRWQQVWQGILAAHRVGFDPLKLNVVVIPGVNDTEVLDLAALTRDRHWHVRFIEFMPIGNPDCFSERGWVPSEELRQRIRDRWGLEGGRCGAMAQRISFRFLVRWAPWALLAKCRSVFATAATGCACQPMAGYAPAC
jgi:cyclic pyranopterin phosphate synthase